MTRQLKIFVYCPSTYTLPVLNIDPKHYSLQVHWHPSCKEIVLKYYVLQVMFVYMISTFNINVGKMGSKYELLQLKKDVCGARYVINER